MSDPFSFKKKKKDLFKEWVGQFCNSVFCSSRHGWDTLSIGISRSCQRNPRRQVFLKRVSGESLSGVPEHPKTVYT